MSLYLKRLVLPDAEQESSFAMGIRRTCYDSFYPFGTLSAKGLVQVEFEPVTLLCGGNGSGKSTLLNVIAEKLRLQRDTLYNRSNFYEDYLEMCDYRTEGFLPSHSRIITSDDVFDFMLNLRSINMGIDRHREELLSEYLEIRDNERNPFRMESLKDYDRLKKVTMARSKSQSKYVRNFVPDNVREHSNVESAYLYFTEHIQENGLYLLDEPENSLSPERQQELLKFLEDSARFFGCQFVIATHSPFLLAMKNAKIYDLDEDPVDVKRWTELPNVRAYYDFFKEHEREFS